MTSWNIKWRERNTKSSKYTKDMRGWKNTKSSKYEKPKLERDKY